MKSVKQITSYTQHIRHNILYIRVLIRRPLKAESRKGSPFRRNAALLNYLIYSSLRTKRVGPSYDFYFLTRYFFQSLQSAESQAWWPWAPPARRASWSHAKWTQTLRPDPSNGSSTILGRRRMWWRSGTPPTAASAYWRQFCVSVNRRKLRGEKFLKLDVCFCRYTPKVDLDYGTLSCSANNDVGHQAVPCMFQLVAAGEYDAILIYYNISIVCTIECVLDVYSVHVNAIINFFE